MIKVTNLTKQYGDFKAVDDVTLEIQDGEVVGLLGPNGAGKTTTMRMLTGFLAPDIGEIEINGMNINSNEFEIKKIIGYMPESNPLYKDMLVGEFLELTLKLNKIPKAEHKKRLDFAVKAVEIADKYFRPISELSKGYKQRVGLASALLNDPKVLILDEPTEGLDPNQRTIVRKLIKELAKDRTVIISTHVMQEVEAMCDKIIIMHKGQKIADGTKAEILNLKHKGQIINIEVKGENIAEELGKIDYVAELDVEKVKDKSRVKIQIKDSKVQEEKIFEDISQTIAKNKWTIYKMETQSNSLEDVFQDLTK